MMNPNKKNRDRPGKSFVIILSVIIFTQHPDLVSTVHAMTADPSNSIALNGTEPSPIISNQSMTPCHDCHPKGPLSKELKIIENLIKENRFPKAYTLALELEKRYPNDLNALYLVGYIEFKVHFLKRGLLTIGKGLEIDPNNKDFRILKAEILIKQGHPKMARTILLALNQRYPKDQAIKKDLIKTYYPTEVNGNFPAMDQHLFSLGQLAAPFESNTFLPTSLPSWNLSVTGLGIGYSGGAVFDMDAQLETPFSNGIRLVTGWTEYMGFSNEGEAGFNHWIYAGADWRPINNLDILIEAGETSIERAGLYGHVFYNPGPLTLDIQGVNNMVWGDFGQSVQLNGLESGIAVDANIQITQRFSLGGDYWYYLYSLQNGSLPYGILNNTFLYLDYLLTQDPNFDFLVGYDDWTLSAISPAVAAIIPEILRQQYVLAAFNGFKQYDNGLVLNGQIGGFTDFYNHYSSYEGELGIRYPVFNRLTLFGNGLYFGQSTIYSGPAEEVMLGFNIRF